MFYVNLLKFLSFFIMGYGLTNILHFVLEDTLNFQPISSIFFGMEYAWSFSWLTVSALSFIVFDVFLVKVWGNSTTHNAERFKKLVMVLIVLVTCGHIAYVFYLFLSGTMDSEGLLRIGISIFMLFLAIIYMYMEIVRRPRTKPNQFWVWFSTSTGAVAFLIGFAALMKFAPPSEMKKIQDDISIIDTVRDLSQGYEKYFHKNSKLPQNIDVIIKKNFIDTTKLGVQENLKKLRVQILSERSVKICTDLNGNWTYAKRIARYMNNKPIKGQKAYCITRTFEKPKKS